MVFCLLKYLDVILSKSLIGTFEALSLYPFIYLALDIHSPPVCAMFILRHRLCDLALLA